MHVDSLYADPKKDRVATATKHSRERVASDSAEKAEPRPKRQREAETAWWNAKGVEPSSTSKAKVGNQDWWMSSCRPHMND